MHTTLGLEAVKEKISALRFRQLKPERFSRDEIETLKRQVVPKLPTLCRQLFSYGVLSAKGGYWVVPALRIKIRLSSGDYYEMAIRSVSTIFLPFTAWRRVSPSGRRYWR